jgi:predicted CXXCH cytochrome family protein
VALPAAVAAVAAALAAFAGVAPDPRELQYEPRPDPEVNAVENPHDVQGKPLCQRCHARGEKGVRRDPVALCAQCHDPGKMKHPFDVALPNPPADLPFGANGRIVCHTCHDPHAVKVRKSGLRLEYRELCLRCHSGHRSAAGRVH